MIKIEDKKIEIEKIEDKKIEIEKIEDKKVENENTEMLSKESIVKVTTDKKNIDKKAGYDTGFPDDYDSNESYKNEIDSSEDDDINFSKIKKMKFKDFSKVWFIDNFNLCYGEKSDDEKENGKILMKEVKLRESRVKRFIEDEYSGDIFLEFLYEVNESYTQFANYLIENGKFPEKHPKEGNIEYSKGIDIIINFMIGKLQSKRLSRYYRKFKCNTKYRSQRKYYSKNADKIKIKNNLRSLKSVYGMNDDEAVKYNQMKEKKKKMKTSGDDESNEYEKLKTDMKKMRELHKKEKKN
jgi:hypothetical protein